MQRVLARASALSILPLTVRGAVGTSPVQRKNGEGGGGVGVGFKSGIDLAGPGRDLYSLVTSSVCYPKAEISCDNFGKGANIHSWASRVFA